MAESTSAFLDGTMVPLRLISRLDDLLDGRVAVVSGPAGFHKTALVRAWLDRDPDIDDNSIQGIIRRDTTHHSSRGVLDAVSERVGKGKPVVVFIDNQDNLSDIRIVHELLDAADRYSDMRLILAGRNRPNVPLSGLATRGLLIDIDASDLALTSKEVAELLTTHQIDSETTVEMIMDEYEGWPIAVELLCNQKLSGSSVPFLSPIITDYLREEVLESVTEEELHFLQDLSALSEFSPQGAAYISGRSDAGPRITALAAKGIPLTWASGNIIHLNPALRRYLISSLSQSDPVRHSIQNRKASSWLQRQGQAKDAIQHALSSHDSQLIYDLFTNYVFSNLTTDDAEVAAYVEELAPSLPDNFQLPLVRAMLLAVAQPDAAPVAVLRSIENDITPEATAAELARFYYVVLYVARDDVYTEDTTMVAKAVEFAEKVFCSELDLPQIETALLMGEYGIYLIEHGDLAKAADSLQLSVSAAKVASIHWVATWSLGGLAMVNAITGGAGPTRRLAEEAVLSAETRGIKDAAAVELSMLALATVALDLGDLNESQSQLDRLFRLPGYLMPGNAALRTFVSATLLSSKDEHRQALQSVRAFRNTMSGKLTPYHRYLMATVEFTAQLHLGVLTDAKDTLTMIEELDLSDDIKGMLVLEARWLLARGEAQQAFERLSPFVDSDQPFNNARHWLLLLMTYGMAATQCNRNEAALSAFQRAGVLADRLGLNTPTARHTRTASQLRQDQLDLTTAETKVLRELASNATLSEIAQQLFISPNTLKTHLRRIYRKLGVGGRNEAIERAKVLGLRVD